MAADTGMSGYGRVDVVVDTNMAKHAMWIESGRNSMVGLPYSKKGGRDYRKSKFKGYEYLQKAKRRILTSSNIRTTIYIEIIRKLITPSGFSNFNVVSGE
jgi:hypothetical protein